MLFDRKQDKFREECGVFGVFKDYTSELGEIFYPGLVSLQHRGEESSGISYTTSKGMITKKALGMVSNLFSKEDFYKMKLVNKPLKTYKVNTLTQLKQKI